MTAEKIALQLADFYHEPFSGKTLGRYRISMKHLCKMADRKRLFPDEIAAIFKEAYQLGYVLIDMETYFVVINHKTFANYRRFNDSML